MVSEPSCSTSKKITWSRSDSTSDQIREGDTVRHYRPPRIHQRGVVMAWWVVVVNTLGEPIDGKGPWRSAEMPLSASLDGVIYRQPVK